MVKKSKIVCKKSRLENPLTGEYSYVNEYSFEQDGRAVGAIIQCDDNVYRYFSYSNASTSYMAQELRTISDKLDQLNRS